MKNYLLLVRIPFTDGQGSLSIIDEVGNIDELENLGNTVQSVTVLIIIFL